MLDVKKLRRDINKKLSNWNEKSSFTLGGVKNLSLSDMDTLLMFCDEYEKTGSLATFIMNDEAKIILKKYGM